MTLTIPVIAADGAPSTVTLPDPVVNSPADPWASLDGRANAPAGTPQFATLLNNPKYVPAGVAPGRYLWPSQAAFNPSTGKYYQPQFHVPGVDYAVGPRPGTVFKDPSAISIPGVTVSASGHKVTVGAAGAVISGIDFSLDGGWQCIISAANVTITDCNFMSGSNISGMLSMLNGDNNSNTNLTVQYTVLNGADVTGSQSSVVGNIRGAKFRYCLIENSNQDLLDFGGSGSTAVPIDVQYCVFHNDGKAGGHADWIQVGGAAYTITLKFNLAYSVGGSGSGSQGWMVDTVNGGTVVGANEMAYNTIVLGAGANVNFCFSLTTSSGSGNTGSIHDNYADLTGNNDAFAKGNATKTNNVSMLTGAEIPGF